MYNNCTPITDFFFFAKALDFCGGTLFLPPDVEIYLRENCISLVIFNKSFSVNTSLTVQKN